MTQSDDIALVLRCQIVEICHVLARVSILLLSVLVVPHLYFTTLNLVFSVDLWPLLVHGMILDTMFVVILAQICCNVKLIGSDHL